MVIEHHICDGCGKDYEQIEIYDLYQSEDENRSDFLLYRTRADCQRMRVDLCPECMKPICEEIRAALKE